MISNRFCNSRVFLWCSDKVVFSYVKFVDISEMVRLILSGDWTSRPRVEDILSCNWLIDWLLLAYLISLTRNGMKTYSSILDQDSFPFELIVRIVQGTSVCLEALHFFLNDFICRGCFFNLWLVGFGLLPYRSVNWPKQGNKSTCLISCISSSTAATSRRSLSILDTSANPSSMATTHLSFCSWTLSSRVPWNRDWVSLSVSDMLLAFEIGDWPPFSKVHYSAEDWAESSRIGLDQIHHDECLDTTRLGESSAAD